MQRFSARLIRRVARMKDPAQTQAPSVSQTRYRTAEVYRVVVGAENKADARRQLRRDYPPPRFAIGRIAPLDT